jgi:hypothetical protein
VRPHVHLVQATARREEVAEVLATHLRDTLALAPALPSLKRSLACVLAFDHFRPTPASAVSRHHALVTLVTRQMLDEPTPPSASAAEALGLALTLLQHASSPDATAAQHVGQLLALCYVQALAGTSSEALNAACAAALVTLAAQTPLVRSEILPVFPALEAVV